MSKYADIINPANIPQSEPLNPTQVQNNAGGFVYSLDKWARLDRFLILGSDSPTYYQEARPLTLENAKVVRECWEEDALRTAAQIKQISFSGRAPKNDPAIFALAIGATIGNQDNDKHTEIRRLALAQLSHVCRTSTHLFQFVKLTRALGKGWGRALKNAVGDWYTNRPLDGVAYQAVKYREREGFTHKRLLELSHAPSKDDEARHNLYKWMKGKEADTSILPPIVIGHLSAMAVGNDPHAWSKLTERYKLPWEALPTEANAHAEVWRAMIPDMGLTALIRNLGNMTRLGAIAPLSDTEAEVVKRITDEDGLRRARVHPFSILQALAVYRSGHGVRGSNSWTPSQAVLWALDSAFYKAFANVEASGKRHLIALDVSGSMGSPFGGSVLSCREAVAALSLVTLNVEPQTHIVGFTSGMRARGYLGHTGRADDISPLQITKGQRLTDVVQYTSGLNFGGTDCALPMIYAERERIPVDVFSIYTDNETWAGSIHPMVALRSYRKAMNINAKLVVVGMTSTGFSIADPNDGGAMDVVGFDASCPALISDFAKQ